MTKRKGVRGYYIEYFEPFTVEGIISQTVFENTVEYCMRLGIIINYKSSTSLHAGDVTVYDSTLKERPEIKINKDFNRTQIYATLAHELAHLFLGHLGMIEGLCEYRESIDKQSKELEAESSAYIVCKRAGIKTKSDKYLSMYLKDEFDIASISIDSIIKVAGKTKQMGKRLFSKLVLN
jgi:antirestriction protein ArdC